MTESFYSWRLSVYVTATPLIAQVLPGYHVVSPQHQDVLVEIIGGAISMHGIAGNVRDILRKLEESTGHAAQASSLEIDLSRATPDIGLLVFEPQNPRDMFALGQEIEEQVNAAVEEWGSRGD